MRKSTSTLSADNTTGHKSQLKVASVNRYLKQKTQWLFVLLLFIAGKQAAGCTNFIITKGASADGSVMITYAADSHTRYGSLFFYPAADYKAGSMLDIFHYENGKLLGQIPQVPHTYSVIGFMNEHRVAIGETTFGGLDSLAVQPGAILDYGSLMKIALQRAKTAREAIRVMTELVEQYGYASSGESFSISDANEAWIMEMIGKGKHEKGAVWVALQIPDGYVSGHANQARITNFSYQKKMKWNDPKQTCFHSPDVISFARKAGFYKGSDADFSFSDTYAPVKFSGARACDARVWSFFRVLNADIANNNELTSYAKGIIRHDSILVSGAKNENKYATNRLPLWIKPDKKVSLSDVFSGMRNHYEGTDLDMFTDYGAGQYKVPYRWRPMDYTVDGKSYCNERAVATQQTGYSFVAQSRENLPAPVGGIFWFGVDDADGCVYAPMYCGIDSIPQSYATGNGSMIEWSETSAFWTFNLVNNWAYTRYSYIHPEIETYQAELEQKYMKDIAETDQKAVAMYAQNPSQAIRLITDFSVSTGNKLVTDWKRFFQYLFMKYMDGNMKKTENRRLLDNGNGKGIPAKPSFPGYGKEWEEKMVKECGDRFLVK